VIRNHGLSHDAQGPRCSRDDGDDLGNSEGDDLDNSEGDDDGRELGNGDDDKRDHRSNWELRNSDGDMTGYHQIRPSHCQNNGHGSAQRGTEGQQKTQRGPPPPPECRMIYEPCSSWNFDEFRVCA